MGIRQEKGISKQAKPSRPRATAKAAPDPELMLLDSLFDRLFPICRSIAGPGFRESFRILSEQIPFKKLEFESGSRVYDWDVPPEWIIEDAYIVDPDGRKIIDIRSSNLHVVNFSAPIDAEMGLEELHGHLHSIPELPDAIPYVTSYYKRNWGFCLSHRQLQSLKPGRYKVVIRSKFKKGAVLVGEHLLPGASRREVLLSTYLCHPSMANNELSGPLVQAALFHRIRRWKRRHLSYRFVILPETIGSICYLSRRGLALRKNLISGLVLTCLGGVNPGLSYKKSRQEHSLLDRLVTYLAVEKFERLSQREFSPTSGSDERQYCSPGFDLPVGQVARDIYGEYAGYHNSLDDKEFVQIPSLIRSVDQIERILLDLDCSGHFQNLKPYGEVQLGRRGLYPNMNSRGTQSSSSDVQVDGREQLNRILSILNYSDGKRDMLEIARKLGVRPSQLRAQIELLESQGLLRAENLGTAK